MSANDWALSHNQETMSRTNELDEDGEARLYKALRHCWHPVMYTSELGEGPAQAMLCGEQLAVVRLDGEVRVFNDLCAHRGTALSLGKVVDRPGCGQELRCAYHGWQYNAEGKCTVIPQRPDLAGQLRARVRTYQAVERYGMVWVCLVDDPLLPLPEFQPFDDPSYATIQMENSDWTCTAARRMENFVDLGHFAILHDGYLGLVDHPEVPKHDVWREANVLRIKQLEQSREPVNLKFEKEELADEYTWTDQQWWIYMPLTVLLDQGLPGDRHYWLFFHPTPIAPNVTRNFSVHARNYGDPAKMEQELVEFSRFIYAQDKPVVEAQRPQMLQEDLSYELHLKGVDTVAMMYRKWLVELADQVYPRPG